MLAPSNLAQVRVVIIRRVGHGCCGHGILVMPDGVRVHGRGKHARFTGLKPAGLGVGPVIPDAEKAIESGDAGALEQVLVTAVRQELAERFHRLHHLHGSAHRGVDGAGASSQAMLGLRVWAHRLYEAARGTGHAASHVHDAA